MLIKRQRGDNYPIIATLKFNGKVVNLTNSTVNFSFKLREIEDDAVETIINIEGVNEGNGVVKFSPTEAQMGVSGEYIYDIQRRTDDGIVSTHLSGILVLSDDVSE